MNSNNSEEDGTRVRDYAGVFDAYIRVFNPAYRSATRQPVAWSTLAEAPIVLRSDTQWSDLVGGRRRTDLDEPIMGSIDPATADALSEILGSDATTSPSCDFAFWTGYADTRVPLNAPLVISPPERTLFVVNAPVQSAAQLNSSPRRALRWWPRDESWRVGNDIYARTVFIGGRRKTIDAIRADPRLESIIVGPDDPVGPEDR